MSKELLALARVVKVFRKRLGEDTIGVLIYTGCFLDMSKDEMLDIADRIDQIIGDIEVERQGDNRC